MASPQSPQARAAADKYLETKVMSASPSELRLMLLDGAIKFCRQGREGLASAQYEAMYNGFTRTRAILVELMSTMKPEPDRQLYDRLYALYTFLITHLLEASLEKNVAKVDRVIELLQFDRETWVMCMERAAAEQRGGAPAAAPAPTPMGEAISVQG